MSKILFTGQLTPEAVRVLGVPSEGGRLEIFFSNPDPTPSAYAYAVAPVYAEVAPPTTWRVTSERLDGVTSASTPADDPVGQFAVTNTREIISIGQEQVLWLAAPYGTIYANVVLTAE